MLYKPCHMPIPHELNFDRCGLVKGHDGPCQATPAPPLPTWADVQAIFDGDSDDRS